MIPGKRYTADTLLKLAWRRRWLIVVPAVLLAAAAAAWIDRLPNVYRAATLILVVPQRVPESYVRATVTTRIEDRLQSISQQILSRTRLEKIVQDFNLYPERRSTQVMEDIVERMRNEDISIDIVKGDAFRVSYSAPQPLIAMRVTERLASLFIDESLRDREALAEGTNQFLEAQLDEARRKLEENEKTLEEYQQKYNGELPTQLSANLQGLHNTEMQLQALQDSINRDRDRRLLVERLTADANLDPARDAGAAAPPATEDRSGTVTASEQLRQAEAALVALELRLKPEHPDVKRLKRSIADLKRRAESEAGDSGVATSGKIVTGPADAIRRNRMNETRAELAALDLQLASKMTDENRLRGVLAEYQRRIEATPSREAELASLTRDYDTFQQSYRTLLAKKQDSQIAANLERRQIGEQFRVVDPARVPEKPASPDRPKLYLLALTAALAIGCAFAAAAEFVDRSLRSEEDIRAALNLPVLATIPTIGRGRRRTGGGDRNSHV